MNFIDICKTRYSVRAYKADAVEEEKLQTILEAAALAPTAVNKQPFRIIVAHTAQNKQELARIYHREWFTEAPLLLCVCAVLDEGWVRSSDSKNYAYIDTCIIMTQILMAATDLGLGTCWVGNFNAENAREVLRLPENVEPIAFTPLGYAADEPEPRERRPLNELVHYERW